MQIRDTFATPIQERIEPVVKVGDRSSAIVHNELSSLIVTPQWEEHINRVLDAYVDAATRDHEQGIGIWISGFFGSGKSLLLKIIGLLLEGGDVESTSVHALFLNRLKPGSPYLADIRRFLSSLKLRIATTVVGGNLHSMLADADDRLPLIVFRLFAEKRGYTHNWPFAWTIEYQIDEQNLSEPFRRRAEEIAGAEWAELVVDPEYHLEALYMAAAQTLADKFSDAAAVERAVNAIYTSGINDQRLIERLRRWCERRDKGNIRHKLLIQLDELGQWIASGNANSRIMQIQSLSEKAAEQGGGRVWLAVTAHGDVQSLRQNVEQEQYAKIIQRFAIHAKLSNDDINKVVEERVLQKKQTARVLLEERFQARSGDLIDIGRVEKSLRSYPIPNLQNFPLNYPYLPWTVQVIPDVVKGIAQAANRDEALTGSNRTMIAVVQGALLDTPGLLDSPVGRVLSLAHLYRQLSADVPVETKTDLNRIRETVEDGSEFTELVACGLFLLGQATYIAATAPNVARTVISDLDVNFAALCKKVTTELERLVEARYAKVVGEVYTFLNTQQRTFQDDVRDEADDLSNQSYNLSQALKAYGGDSALRFDKAPLHNSEIQVRVDLDGQNLHNPTSHVTISVLSPLQRAIDPKISDDTEMRHRSTNDETSIYLRLAEVTGFRQALARAVATENVANEVLARSEDNSPEAGIARHARNNDLPPLQDEVRKLLGRAVRQAQLFYKGVIYQVDNADNAGEGIRNTLKNILPTIYTRFNELPQRINDDQRAVRAALTLNSNQPDLRNLGIFRADGTINDGHPLLSALRARLPLADQDQAAMLANDLRQEFERPPYGWDGHTMKIGLALLLQRSQCRLIFNGQVINNPSDPQAESVLATERNFRQVRVQGVSGTLGVIELRAIRQSMVQVFNRSGSKEVVSHNIQLVPATLHAALGDALGLLLKETHELSEWANTAQCPLPQPMQAGETLAQELLNNGSEVRRLRHFQEQAEAMGNFAHLISQVKTFRREQGEQFRTVRDFYTSMVNVHVDLPELRTFLDDFRALLNTGEITMPARWHELIHSFQAAQQALEHQAKQWQTEIQETIAGVNARLEGAVSAAGVPQGEVRNEAAVLSDLYTDIRTKLKNAKGALDFGAARTLLAQLTKVELEKEAQLRELQTRYRAAPSPDATHLTWQTLLRGPAHINDMDDLNQLLDELRRRIEGYLANRKKIVIE